MGKSEIWGIQYHPEIPYDYMIKLIKQRSKGLINNRVFKNQDEINQHISSIEKAKLVLSDDVRTIELKNWITAFPYRLVCVHSRTIITFHRFWHKRCSFTK